MTHVDVVIAGLVQVPGRLLRKLPNAFDGEDLTCNLREDSRRVTTAGTYLQYFFAAAQAQGLDHEGDDVGLRNCLAGADRKGAIFISLALEILRHEELLAAPFAWRQARADRVRHALRFARKQSGRLMSLSPSTETLQPGYSSSFLRSPYHFQKTPAFSSFRRAVVTMT